jgi:hypothetical protein
MVVKQGVVQIPESHSRHSSSSLNEFLLSGISGLRRGLGMDRGRGVEDGGFGYELRLADANGLGGLVAEGDLHAVNPVDGGVAGGGAAQDSHESIWNETHVHQVVLDGFREVKGDENATCTNL